MNKKHMDRRDFLRTSAATAAGISLPYLIPAGVFGQPGPNDKVNIGIIGLRRPGAGIAEACRGVQGPRGGRLRLLPAVVRQVRRGPRKGPELEDYEDFRKMIEKEKLDAVMVETTTHARAWIAIQAMQAGVDAYIEKPMCLTIAEGRTMVNAARKYNRVTQVGTQQRSMPINNWASDLVKNGALGKVLTVIAPNFVGPDMDRPTRRNDAQGRQRQLVGHLDQPGSGAALSHKHPSRLGPLVGLRRRRPLLRRHRLGHPLLRPGQPRLGTDDTGPVEILLEEPVKVRSTGKFAPKLRLGGIVDKEDTGTDYHGMAKLEGPRAKVTMKFAGGTQLKLHLDGDRGPGFGAIFVCEKGKLEINRNKLASNPKDIIRSRTTPAPTSGTRRPTTSRTGSSASRAAGAATPTSRSASGPPRSATW